MTSAEIIKGLAKEIGATQSEIKEALTFYCVRAEIKNQVEWDRITKAAPTLPNVPNKVIKLGGRK